MFRLSSSDLCPTGVLRSAAMFLTGSPGGLSACRTGDAPKPVLAAALISSLRPWWRLDEMAARAVADALRVAAPDLAGLPVMLPSLAGRDDPVRTTS